MRAAKTVTAKTTPIAAMITNRDQQQVVSRGKQSFVKMRHKAHRIPSFHLLMFGLFLIIHSVVNSLGTAVSADQIPDHQWSSAGRPQRQAAATSDSLGAETDQPARHTIWDFSTLGGRGSTWLAPRFGVEPPSMVEYSNSTGTVIACRPTSSSLVGHDAGAPSTNRGGSQQEQQQQTTAAARRPSAAGTPTSITWRLVRQLARVVATSDSATGASLADELDEEMEAGQAGGLRYVRQDGSLVLAPFKAADYKPELHAATYRCCLGNRFGALCSRPVRTRAVVDSSFTVEVFDEFVLAGNSLALKCQVPPHLRRHLDFVAWLKDDKVIVTQDGGGSLGSAAFGGRRRFGGDAGIGAAATDEQWPQKYLMLQTGELYIRNASKPDAGAYKCRVRHKLTGSLVTSKIGGQLMVDESQSRSELRPTGGGGSTSARGQLASQGATTVVLGRENAQRTFICAQVQSYPVAKFTWYRQVDGAGGERRQLLVGAGGPDSSEMKQIDSCLLIKQVQQRHAGDYICEANNGDSTLRSTIRLLVTSAQLTAQLQPMAAPPPPQQSATAAAPSPAIHYSRSGGAAQQIVPFGSTIYLNCSIAGYPHDTVAWFKDAKLLAVGDTTTTLQGSNNKADHHSRTSASSSRTTSLLDQQSSNVKLVQPTVISIESFGLKDRGVYQCQVYSVNLTSSAYAPAASEVEILLERDLTRAASASIQLDAAFTRPAIVQKFAPDQTLQRGGPISLQCSATGLPIPRVVWFLDGQPIAALSSSSAAATDDINEPLELDSHDEWQHDDDDDRLTARMEDERFQISSHTLTSYSGAAAAGGSGGQPMMVSQLNVSRASATETGQYKCLALNSLGSAHYSGQVNVQGGLELRTYQPTNVTIVAGQTWRLQCPLIGYPLSRVDWFRNDQRLPVTHRQRVEPVELGAGGQLELTNVDKQADGGVYTCRAIMQAAANGTSGAAQADDYLDDLVGQVRVNVRMAPMIDTQSLPELVQANEGMRAKLVCSVVQGDHPVDIRWLRRTSDRSKVAQIGRTRLVGFELVQNSRGGSGGGGSGAASASSSLLNDDELVPPDEDSITIHNLEDSCLLTFKRISYTDSADYMCLAQNEVGQANRLTRVIVNVAPSWSLEPAAEVSFQLGARLQLDCMAHGFPVPTVAWRRHESSQPATSTITSTALDGRVYTNGSLIIDQVEQTDAGFYMCEVANGVGAGLSKVVRVRVNVPPYFMHRATTQLSQLGGRTELRCVAHGDHPMVIGWRKDGDVVDLVTDNRHRLVGEHKISSQALESTLSISSLARNDSGQYVCIASNEHGTEDMRIQLVVQEPPEAPLLLRPVRAGSRQATLSFRPPYSGNSQIRKYAIETSPTTAANHSMQPAASNWQQILVEAPISLDGNDTTAAASSQLVSLDLCCLQPFSGYAVRVRAINDVGQSEPSKAVQFVTDEEAIGGPPLDVGVEPTGAHSLKVRWRPPSKSLQNGLIRGYYIGYRAISNVSESEQYQYKNIQLELSPMNFGRQELGTAQISPPVFSSHLTNLRRKTAYSIIVQAYNKIGAGPRSDQIVLSTLDAAPPMSPVLRLAGVTHNSAQLTWSGRKFNTTSATTASRLSSRPLMIGAVDLAESALDEEEDDDPHSYYTINFKTEDRLPLLGSSSSSSNNNNNNDDWQQRRVTKRQQTPFILSNLRCGSHHSAFMTATNSLGQSEPGETIRFVTLGAAPVAPSNSREFLYVNSTYVIMRLDAWHNAGCLISSFVIKYKTTNQAKWTILEHQVHPTIQTVTIAGSAVFATRPVGQSMDDNSNSNSMQQQNISDFIIRNLAVGSTYKLSVEATSEAGSTLAEYEFETANFSSSTVAISVNGVVASEETTNRADGGKGGRASLESSDSGDLDFIYSGGQRASSSLQRSSLGIWSLTALFVVASIVMATTTLVLGLKSLLRMKAMSSRSSRDSLLAAILCCANNSSASSSSGADSSHSSSGGTCYQAPEHHQQLGATYCSLPAGHATLVHDDGAEPTQGGGDPVGPYGRQMVPSSSMYGRIGGGGGGDSRERYAQTLASVAHCQAQNGHVARTHYAATLGKQQPIFTLAGPPIKCNETFEDPACSFGIYQPTDTYQMNMYGHFDHNSIDQFDQQQMATGFPTLRTNSRTTVDPF